MPGVAKGSKRGSTRLEEHGAILGLGVTCYGPRIRHFFIWTYMLRKGSQTAARCLRSSAERGGGVLNEDCLSGAD